MSENEAVAVSSNTSFVSSHLDHNKRGSSHIVNPPITTVSSNQDYFPSDSMNQTVRLVRDKLDKIQASGEHPQAESASKKARVDNRRRI
ncbi:hypothetical protein PIB30_104897 [Stylosanthes scabra]|uniref:Uncharacterized protein n=1 Tax=Stylosanthes scabra TaxID=79078 RepID=A0ABU6V0H1_9FABA|nr:hypothetical protein [Stylosanthes scabra]